MSEGINFSDELARCVCVVGMPYPNIGSAEMIEKMRYLDSMKLKSSSSGDNTGRAYYENTCWKAINQSIGRAIRHRGDYACLLLIDKRYSKSNIPSRLPQWLANSFRQMNNFDETSKAIQQVLFADYLSCFIHSNVFLVLCSTFNKFNSINDRTCLLKFFYT